MTFLTDRDAWRVTLGAGIFPLDHGIMSSSNSDQVCRGGRTNVNLFRLLNGSLIDYSPGWLLFYSNTLSNPKPKITSWGCSSLKS
mmetsp:Transcript_10652/g.21449  ORF Transcript_10652/g.21449 Transcript_10652/m.21449 type:complete len:85 (+) Transcript_10652:389-643(+)